MKNICKNCINLCRNKNGLYCLYISVWGKVTEHFYCGYFKKKDKTTEKGMNDV